jgi:O-antigen ligase
MTRRPGVARPLLLILLALLYPFHRTVGGINVSLGDGIVALVCVLLLLVLALRRVPLPRYLLPAGVLIVVIAVSLLVNTLAPPGSFFEPRATLVELLKVFAVVAWMVSLCWLMGDDFPRRYLVWATASVLIATGFAVLTVYENLFRHVERPAGPFENANLYGNYLMLNAFLAFGAYALLGEDRAGTAMGSPRALRGARGLFLLGALPVLAVGMMATGSRGTLLALFAGGVTLGRWRLPRPLRARQVAAVMLGAAALATAVVWFLDQHPYLLHRLARTGSEDPNVTERLALWRAARDAFFANPVFGIGYGQFPAYAKLVHHLVPKVTHETYLSYAAELGLPGLAVFLWLLGAVVRDAHRASLAVGTALPRLCFAFLIATAVQALVNNVDQFRSLWIAVGMVAAMRTAAGPGVAPSFRTRMRVSRPPAASRSAVASTAE